MRYQRDYCGQHRREGCWASNNNISSIFKHITRPSDYGKCHEVKSLAKFRLSILRRETVHRDIGVLASLWCVVHVCVGRRRPLMLFERFWYAQLFSRCAHIYRNVLSSNRVKQIPTTTKRWDKIIKQNTGHELWNARKHVNPAVWCARWTSEQEERAQMTDTKAVSTTHSEESIKHNSSE